MPIVFMQEDSETTSGSASCNVAPVRVSKKNGKEKHFLHTVFLIGARLNLNDGYSQFFNAAKNWRAAGYVVVNPIEICQEADADDTRITILKQSYHDLIHHCDAVALLPGWRDCAIATAEVHLAQALGYCIFAATEPGLSIDLEPESTHYMRKAFAELHMAKATLRSEAALRKQETSACTPKEAVTPTCLLDNLAKRGLPACGMATLISDAVAELDAAEAACGVTGEDFKESCCDIADRLVATDRQNDYGCPVDDFTRIAGMATSLGFRFHNAAGVVRDILPSDHGIWMVLMKISREMHKHKRDNLIDGAGYFKCLDMLHNLQ